MRRPWIIIGILIGALAVFAIAITWISILLVHIDRRDAAMQASAETEENARLALWRMDAALTGLIAARDAPRFPFAKLSFEVDSSGNIGNPSDPNALGKLSHSHVDGNRLLAASATWQQLQTFEFGTAAGAEHGSAADQVAAHDPNSAPPTTARKGGRQRNTFEQQMLRSQTEFMQRQQSNMSNQALLDRPLVVEPEAARVRLVGPTHAVWVEDNLFLLQRAERGGSQLLQGRWLDWPALQASLLSQIADLLPNARLVPVATGAANADPHTLATMPIQLIPGSPKTFEHTVSAPIRSSLAVVWAASAIALTAVVVLVWGVVVQSERRAAFVSAVTHELRTPLTTFRMYSQMLERNMITDEQDRRQYLRTLRGEADRLTQLVENVLAFARLERHRQIQRSDDVTVSELVERLLPRLQERVAQAGMSLEQTADTSVQRRRLWTNVSVVDQIVFNLIDNACKYAARADDKRIVLHVDVEDQHLHLDVVDFGPGIEVPQARKLFRPFQKSARQSAETAAGLGLGLALARRLAHQLAGDLQWIKSGEPGSRFRLTLPAEP